MKLWKKILILALSVSNNVFADQFSFDFFYQNESQIYTGLNPITGSPCTVAFFDGVMFYHFSKKIENVHNRSEALQYHMNSIGPGHFTKKILRSSIVNFEGGEFSAPCLFMNRCGKSRMELDFQGQKPTALSYFFNSSSNRNNPPQLENRCQLTE